MNGEILTSVDVKDVEEVEPGYRLGTAVIFGTPHHAEFLELTERVGSTLALLHESPYNRERLEALREHCDGEDPLPITSPWTGGPCAVLITPCQR